MNTATGEIVTLGATEHGAKWDHNTHRVVIQTETNDAFIGWPDQTDPRNSEHWKPGTGRPMLYPKFAWEVRHD